MANGSSQSCEAGFESLNLACSTQRVQVQNMTISQHTVMRGWNKMRRRGNYDSADYMETKWTHKADEKCKH